LLKDYNNWCPEIYRNIFIDRVNDDCIRVAPCCQAGGAIESVDTFDFQTSPHLNKLRQQFDNNEKPIECVRCWQAENTGHKSRRMSAIEFYNVDPATEVILEGIDHSATWACNLACIMCSPENSSLWASQKNLTQDKLKLMGRYFQKSNNFLDNLDVTHIKKIHFNGGEPMLNDDQTKLLLKLKEQGALKNTFISYNTNGTVIPSKQVIDLWKQARLVKIFFSIDAIGRAFEYVRWPGKWDQTSKNILDMKANLPGNVMFGFNTTVGNYNVLEIAEVYDWFNEHMRTNREGDPSDFCWQLADNFDPGGAPKIIKMQAIDELESIVELSGLVGYLKLTLVNPENTTWMTKLDELDIKRNTSWRTALKTAQFIKDQNC
jgi:hypothetical protein